MVNETRVLALVLARGGSQGIPRKNLQLLAGHPLVAWSIASARAAQSVTRVIASTDDEEIAAVCRRFGADVPFMRPSSIAAADTPDLPVFQHALAWLAEHERYRPDIVVQLRPTSPLRPRGLIDHAVSVLRADDQADCVRGVTPAGQNPYKMWRSDATGYLSPLMQGEFAEPYNMPRQQLPSVFWQTGHIDAIWSRTILERSSLTGNRVRPVTIESKYCVDIDTQRDLQLASWVLSHGGVDVDRPRGREWPQRLGLLVLDFDGVVTDNRVWVSEDGHESVACDRGDGMGLAMLRRAGFEVIVLSTEVNPVVAARCRKLDLPYVHGLADKEAALTAAAAERGVPLADVAYVGNDVNDVTCMRAAGFSLAPADAHPEAAAVADLMLDHAGGRGAVREVCDEILRRYGATRVTNG
jgi:YrbI family 3-deoxy-D-manno-octulosonate 8-phosphate phosphatase